MELVQKPPNLSVSVSTVMTLIDFTLSNARRFYSSMGNPSDTEGLKVTDSLNKLGNATIWSTKQTGMLDARTKMRKKSALFVFCQLKNFTQEKLPFCGEIQATHLLNLGVFFSFFSDIFFYCPVCFLLS